jgi:hypothetical protein
MLLSIQIQCSCKLAGMLQLSLDLIEQWSVDHPEASICTAQGAPQFRRIANFQDYHGLPEFREVTN